MWDKKNDNRHNHGFSVRTIPSVATRPDTTGATVPIPIAHDTMWRNHTTSWDCHMTSSRRCITKQTTATAWQQCFMVSDGCDKERRQLTRVPTLYEELNSLTFPDHARNFFPTKLTCNSYFSLHFSRLLLPYTDSLCYHHHILNHWEWKGTEAWRK